MGKLSLKLQTKSLREMADRKPYKRKLGNFEYSVFPRVYKGSTDTDLFCNLLEIKEISDLWDVGTGTGLIALAAKKKGARFVLATDINPDAVKNAKENSKLLNLKINVRQADLFGDIKRKFDIITFNPPFTDHKATKTHEKSFWDEDHETVRKFFKDLHNYLKPGGKGLIAWSSFGNTKKLKRLANENSVKLKEIGRKKGKRNFTYYVYEIEFKPEV